MALGTGRKHAVSIGSVGQVFGMQMGRPECRVPEGTCKKKKTTKCSDTQPWGGGNRRGSEVSTWLLLEVGRFLWKKDFTGVLAVSEVRTEPGLHCACLGGTVSCPCTVLGMGYDSKLPTLFLVHTRQSEDCV